MHFYLQTNGIKNLQILVIETITLLLLHLETELKLTRK